jgi:hypothetical protein
MTRDHRRALRMLVLLVGSACAACGPYGPLPGTVSLSGTVVVLGPSTPVEGADVSCQASSTTTGADGRYSLSELSPGYASVTVSKPGYALCSKSIMLEWGSNTLDFAMSTAGCSVSGGADWSATGRATSRRGPVRFLAERVSGTTAGPEAASSPSPLRPSRR